MEWNVKYSTKNLSVEVWVAVNAELVIYGSAAEKEVENVGQRRKGGRGSGEESDVLQDVAGKGLKGGDHLELLICISGRAFIYSRGPASK